MRLQHAVRIGIWRSWFLGREENPRSKERTNNTWQRNPHVAPGRNQTRATLVRGKLSHHCASDFERVRSFLELEKWALRMIQTTHKRSFREFQERTFGMKF